MVDNEGMGRKKSKGISSIPSVQFLLTARAMRSDDDDDALV